MAQFYKESFGVSSFHFSFI